LRRLGLLIPSSNTTMETEFRKLLPENVSLHSARLRLLSATIDQLAKMEEELEEEAVKLADANVEVIGFGCTSGSFFKGIGFDKEIERKIRVTTGKPAISTSHAVLKALRFLKVRKVAVATPYIDEINYQLKNFLEDNRFEVVDLEGLGITDVLTIGRIDDQTLENLVKKLNYEDADCIFISCTNLPTVDSIEKLENNCGKPVISANTATLWAMLRKIGIHTQIKGFGKLLKHV